ncbi:unnamed protein product [Blepharisma stoltei]|uniref:Uncharacterized protein n=1 Tax=Blepharisma stoltei TaxID=1481888 RepID=A0AAU9IGV3_9CILI|nr:unnamed protein product [Blepharisma stoltei]
MNLHKRFLSDNYLIASSSTDTWWPSVEKSPQLPNLRIRKKKKHPKSVRDISSEEGMIKLQSQLQELEALQSENNEEDLLSDDKSKTSTRPITMQSSPMLLKTYTGEFINQKRNIESELRKMHHHIEENLKVTKSSTGRRRRHKYNVSMPVLEYDSTMMPTDLIIMAQVRRGLMNEVKNKSISNLTFEKIEEIKRNYIPEQLKNLENIKENLQKQKQKKELLSRNPLSNASYHILAFDKKSKKNLRKSLIETLPDASRFQAHSKIQPKTLKY